MVKVQAIIDFNYKNYNKIKDLQPTNKIQEGKIFAGDIFNVEDDEAKYLAGENKNKIVAVKVLEVKPTETTMIEQKIDNISMKIGEKSITLSADKIELDNITLVKEKEKPKKITTKGKNKNNKKKENI